MSEQRNAVAAARPRPDDDAVVDADVRDARILIVDDSASANQLLRAVLRKAGYANIAMANDGVEAWAAACNSPPDLVITDLLMPNMDGFELCRKLRSDRVMSAVPVLVQTGSENPQDRGAALNAGAAAVIGKPLNVQELLALVRVHVERSWLIERLSEYKRYMAYEVDKARQMQESLLPGEADLRRLEAIYPMAVASHFRASEGIGGDLWGVRALDASRLGVYSADFAGHGLSAALNTFRLHSILLRGGVGATDAAAWMMQLNGILCDILPVGQFATMFGAIIDFSASTLQYASAAAPSNLVLSAGTRPDFHPIDGAGHPLGMTRDATYENHVVPFKPGSMLFIYSDALVETPDPVNAAFREQTLRGFLNARQHETNPAAVQDAVLDEFYAKCPGKPADDLTVVILSHLGAAP